MNTEQNVPADFPRKGTLSAVSGVQPKLLARIVDGQYVVGLTDAEHRERYATCQDLVEQLVEYCRRKLLESNDSTLPTVLERVRKGAMQKAGAWGLSQQEVEWVLARVSMGLNGDGMSQDMDV
ncbi:hypothetical protein MNJPNG_02650 [Cupriavidus oxalaticus]|uniref:hypothetical protein n=1 Tax=Cupriavidus oxalaticus TaxID=96344 RepID=UPI003F7359CF